MNGRTLRYTDGPAVNLVPGRLVRDLLPPHWSDRSPALIHRDLQAEYAAVHGPPLERTMATIGSISGGRNNLAGPLCIIIRHDCVGTDAFGRKQTRGALAGWGDSGWGDSGIDPKTGAPYAIDPTTGQPYSSSGGSKSGTASSTGLGATADALGRLLGLVTGAAADVKQVFTPPAPTAPPVIQQGSWPAPSGHIMLPMPQAPPSAGVPWGWVFVGLGGVGAALATAAIVLGKR